MINGKYLGKKGKRDVIKMMTDAVDAARKHGAESIGVNAEDASRTDLRLPPGFRLAAKEHGADPLPLLRYAGL